MSTIAGVPAFTSGSCRTLSLLAIAVPMGVAAVWSSAEAAVRPSAQIGQVIAQIHSEACADGRASLALASPTQVHGAPPSAAALALARRLLDPHLSRRLQAQLPDLGEPRSPSAAPSSPWGIEFQLWPRPKLVPVPDLPPLARLGAALG